MTETLPRSFTLSTAAHALAVGLGLALAAHAPRGDARRAVEIAASTLVPFEVERPRAPEPAPPPAPLPAPPAPRAAIAAPRHAPAPAPSAPAPSAPAAPAPSAPTAGAPGPLATSEAGTETVATSPSGAGTSVAPTPAPVAPVAAAPDVAAGPSFDQGAYIAGVSSRVRRHRSYPPIAQEMGLEGDVEVRVVVAPDGTLAAPPAIAESSGHELLDEEAIRIVQRAAPFPPLSGRREALTLRVPVRFHLEG